MLTVGGGRDESKCQRLQLVRCGCGLEGVGMVDFMLNLSTSQGSVSPVIFLWYERDLRQGDLGAWWQGVQWQGGCRS